MRVFIFLSVAFMSINSVAVDSIELCSFLLNRAKVDPKSQLSSKDTMAQMDELLAITDQMNGFVDLSKEGIEKKMTWDTFKKFAAKKGLSVSNFYQPQYDGLYMKKYCGSYTTEANVKIENGRTKENSLKRSFQFTPVPSEHEYSKQIKGAQ